MKVAFRSHNEDLSPFATFHIFSIPGEGYFEPAPLIDGTVAIHFKRHGNSFSDLVENKGKFRKHAGSIKLEDKKVAK